MVNILLLLSRNSSVIKEKASKTYQLVSSKGMQISDELMNMISKSGLWMGDEKLEASSGK